jgi:OPT oligopeptide transporter protein
MSVFLPLCFSHRLARAHQLGHVQGISLDGYEDPNFEPTPSLLEEDSPYPEVRCAVPNTDDPNMPSSTLRTWIIGLSCAVPFSSFVQLYFNGGHHMITPVRVRWLLKRLSSCLVGSFEQILAQLITFPICKVWARYMPNISLLGIPLNPGPFTIKERVIVAIMAHISVGPAYVVSAKFGKLCQCCLRCFLHQFKGYYSFHPKARLPSASQLCLYG